MRRMVGVVLVVALGLLALGAYGCTSPGNVVLTAADDGDAVTVRSGGTLIVELEGNPTTGFTWMEAEVPEMLESRGEPEFESASDALGAGGMMTLTYDAIEAGEGTLELQYARPWESVDAEERFSVTVTVVE
ncbi:MAG: protease inhibitor I42 family protein [Coriobacteriia bacterium]